MEIPLHELTTTYRGALRYFILTLRTAKLLRRCRPRAILVQNPSLVLAALAVCLRPFFGYRLTVDAHNEAVEPFLNRSAPIRWLTHWVLRRADLTIVTNEPLARVVRKIDGKPLVLPDRIPTPPANQAKALEGLNLVLIATYAGDEPYQQVLQAVAGLDLTLYVTGNHLKLPVQVREAAPPNVRFTGFLNEAAYWSLLSQVDGVIDLTTMDNCLVCGAYEAVSLRKPLLLSDNEASISLFADCALFTDNSVASIRERLLQWPAKMEELRCGTERTAERIDAAWKTGAEELRLAMHR